jgi:hypothetical protein
MKYTIGQIILFLLLLVLLGCERSYKPTQAEVLERATRNAAHATVVQIAKDTYRKIYYKLEDCDPRIKVSIDGNKTYDVDKDGLIWHSDFKIEFTDVEGVHRIISNTHIDVRPWSKFEYMKEKEQRTYDLTMNTMKSTVQTMYPDDHWDRSDLTNDIGNGIRRLWRNL